jgi:hypothetical protein
LVAAAVELAMPLVNTTEVLQVDLVEAKEVIEQIILLHQELLVKEIMVDPLLVLVVPVAVAAQDQQEQMVDQTQIMDQLEATVQLLHSQVHQ